MNHRLLKYKALPSDIVTITHLSSAGQVVVWVAKQLLLDSDRGDVIIRGKTGNDNYLPIKVHIEGAQCYPGVRTHSLVRGQLVSIEIIGVTLFNVREIFECNELEKDRIMYRRHAAARLYSINQKTREYYGMLMRDLAEKHTPIPLA